MSETGEHGALDAPGPVATRAKLSAQTKEQLFAELGKIFAETDEALVAADVERGLWERERVQNTAMGDGVAIPHATLAAATHTEFAVVTLAEPVGYKMQDGSHIDVVVCLVGPPSDREAHLRLLSRTARLILDGGLLPGLRAATSPEEINDAFAAASARIAGDDDGQA